MRDNPYQSSLERISRPRIKRPRLLARLLLFAVGTLASFICGLLAYTWMIFGFAYKFGLAAPPPFRMAVGLSAIALGIVVGVLGTWWTAARVFGRPQEDCFK